MLTEEKTTSRLVNQYPVDIILYNIALFFHVIMLIIARHHIIVHILVFCKL